MKRYVIIVAGGKGTRMGSELPKQFLPLAGKPILAHTLDNFYRFDPSMELVVVLPDSQQEYWKQLCLQYHIAIPHHIASGGETRFHSVRNGLALLPDEGVVAHSRRRPPLGGSPGYRALFRSGPGTGRCHTTLPLTDSLRQILPDGNSRAEERSRFVTVQTPQTFRCGEIKRAV